MTYRMSGIAGGNRPSFVRCSIGCALSRLSENTVSICGHNGRLWLPGVRPFGALEGRLFQLAADEGEQ